ncbi:MULTISPECIES: hypothetical protein [Pseudomonas]|jgi:hypothetical protein|uniref:hypothetical protein n=1 Tax=Pseudomonas TaxID=286 RepID=UPI0009B915E6|nr:MULTISPECIES: hypothetical protein [Pseudomonas]PWY40446.1 hypothetical protein DK261_18325 [Pseudomonas sp. RW409]QHC90270.1 hypothetical protein PchlR47_18770 [Pseudomonas chlororaphis]UUT22318.1 hypothetical protein NRG23_32350 [Pseudomonas sp. T8]WJV25478.1 hypothetical protein PSR66_05390 [Pseudomonas chlororaphis]
MSASEKKLYLGRWITGFVCFLIACWYLALPRVVIYYSGDGSKAFKYVFNTQHSIFRRDLMPGETTGDAGHIFPDRDFFMMFDWWADTTPPRCIYITPKRWRTMDIYLDGSGKIDTTKTGTDVIARLKQCPGQPDPFRP